MTLKKSSTPPREEFVGEPCGPADDGDSIAIPVTSLVKGNVTYTVIVFLVPGGTELFPNDIWFSATESDKSSELIVTVVAPEGRLPGNTELKTFDSKRFSADGPLHPP